MLRSGEASAEHRDNAPEKSGAPSWAGPTDGSTDLGSVCTNPRGQPPRGTPTGTVPPTSELLARSWLTSN